jgi:hypothetical protein
MIDLFWMLWEDQSEWVRKLGDAYVNGFKEVSGKVLECESGQCDTYMEWH